LFGCVGGLCWCLGVGMVGRDGELGKVELGLYVHFEVSMLVMVEIRVRFDAAKRSDKDKCYLSKTSEQC
jgi:capsular polysaccharide biosynthesis protein